MDQAVNRDPVAVARGLAETIAAAAEEIEAARRLPDAIVAALHESRLLRMMLPRSCGGDEVDPTTYVRALEEVALHDASVAWNVFVANSTALIAPYLETETADAVFGTATALVAWGPPNDTKAQAVPGGYRISGHWWFASGCRHATWMGAHCDVLEADGTVRIDTEGRSIMLTFLFPASDATLDDDWDTLGMRGTGSESYSVEDLFVPETFTGRRGDPNLCREPGPLYAITMQSLYAASVAAVALGIARAMLEELIGLARRKKPIGLRRMADSATVQAGIARAEAQVGAARAYLLDTLADVYRRAKPRTPIEVADRARIRLAASHAIHAAMAVADQTHKACGVDGIFPGSPFERRFRDMHTLSQQIQSRDSHYESIGRVLLGEPPSVFL
jgi:alkylation response protein AidB-like acyl-CoA dehydrogenase